MKKDKIKRITLIALFSAIAYVLMLLEFPVPLVPSFLQFDFSEFPCIAASFIAGPVDGVLVCLFKNVLHLTVTKTGCVGELANFLIGAPFVFTAGLIFKKKHTFSGSVIGCAAGALASAVVSYPVNLFITYPVYAELMPLDAIIGMYQEIVPSADTLGKALFIFNFPFTLVKCLIVSAINLLCYKKLEALYKK